MVRLDRRLLLLSPAALFVGLFFALPFAYALALSFRPPGSHPTWTGSYHAMITESRGLLALWNSLRLAVPATLIDLCLAAPMAYRLRRPLPGRQLIINSLLVPLTLGSVLLADGMIQLLGPAGWVNHLLLSLHLARQPVALIHNYTGVLISLVLSDFPVVFLVLLGYASGLDPELDSAARVLGAAPARRVLLVSLPSLAPGLAVAAALSFVATFSVFPTATMLGQPAGQTYVMALAAWQVMYERYDYSQAAAIALTMAAAMLAFVALVLWLRGLVYRTGEAG